MSAINRVRQYLRGCNQIGGRGILAYSQGLSGAKLRADDLAAVLHVAERVQALHAEMGDMEAVPLEMAVVWSRLGTILREAVR